MTLLWVALGCVAPADTEAAGDTADANVLAGPSGPARVEFVCGPTDGPALRITAGLEAEGCYADEGSGRRIRITLYAVTEPLEGTYPFDASGGQVWYATDSDSGEEKGLDGQVDIEGWDPAAVFGEYRVRLDSGFEVQGSFEGPYCETDLQCG